MIYYIMADVKLNDGREVKYYYHGKQCGVKWFSPCVCDLTSSLKEWKRRSCAQTWFNRMRLGGPYLAYYLMQIEEGQTFDKAVILDKKIL